MLADTSLKPCSTSFATDVPLAMNVFSAVLTFLSLASVNHAGQRDCSCLGESWKESSLRKLRPRQLINHAQSFIWKEKCVESQQWESVFSCPAQEAGYRALQILKHRRIFLIEIQCTAVKQRNTLFLKQHIHPGLDVCIADVRESALLWQTSTDATVRWWTTGLAFSSKYFPPAISNCSVLFGFRINQLLLIQVLLSAFWDDAVMIT